MLKKFDYFLDDLHYYIENVVKQIEDKNKSLFLLGHSMGGEIAAKYALVYPEDFNYMILSSPSVGTYLAGYRTSTVRNDINWCARTFN